MNLLNAVNRKLDQLSNWKPFESNPPKTPKTAPVPSPSNPYLRQEPTNRYPKDGDQVRMPDGQMKTVKIVSKEEFANVQERATEILEANWKAEEELAVAQKELDGLQTHHVQLQREIEGHRQKEIFANSNIINANKQQEAFLNLKNTFLEQSLQDLPNNWERTGKDQEAFNVIYLEISRVIQLIQDFKKDFLSHDWQEDEEMRLQETVTAIHEAEQLIALTQHWKNI